MKDFANYQNTKLIQKSENKYDPQSNADLNYDNSPEQQFDFKELQKILRIPHNFVKPLQECKSREELSQKFRSVCLIGVTGHGKSSTANSIASAEEFKTCSGVQSVTDQVRGTVTRWFSDNQNDPVIVIDTPGIGDSKGRDTEHIAKMVTTLKQIGYVHTFLIVINSEDNRFNEQLQQTLLLFQSMFGKEYLDNAMICFTKFRYDRRTIKERQTNKKQDESSLIKQYQGLFKEHYKCLPSESQFTFIDNGIASDPDAETQETDKYAQALQSIKEFTENVQPFFCQDIKEVLKEKEQLMEQIRQILAEKEEEKQKFIEEFNQKLLSAVEQEEQKREDFENHLKQQFNKEKAELEQQYIEYIGNLANAESQYDEKIRNLEIEIKKREQEMNDEKRRSEEILRMKERENEELQRSLMMSNHTPFQQQNYPSYGTSQSDQFVFQIHQNQQQQQQEQQQRNLGYSPFHQEDDFKAILGDLSMISSGNDRSTYNQSNYSSSTRAKNLCDDYLDRTQNNTFSGPLKADGTPDYRYRDNRIQGKNMDGTQDSRCYPGPLKKDGTPDMRFKANKRQ